jgi:hypothetical protein
VKFEFSYRFNYLLQTTLLLKLVCICWLVTKLICCKLWLASRFFPLVPVHDFLQAAPAVLHTILLGISLTGMLLFCVFPAKKIAAIIFIAELFSCLLDQNRWQPWEYQFVCMLGAYIFLKDENRIKYCWQLILVSLYFFSGLNKCSPYFIYNVWDNLLLKKLAGIAQPPWWLLKAGYAAALIELLAALALCFAPTRKVAVYTLSAMHLFNLLSLGPTGLQINMAVWPWNLLMPLLLAGLFYKEPFVFLKYRYYKPFYTAIILLAWWGLPWLQLAGYWDKYLSGVLYSGSNEYLYICSNNGVAYKRLSGCLMPANKNMPCDTAISAFKWGMQQMNTAPYPEERVYRAIAASFNKMYPTSTNRFFLYQGGFHKKTRELIIHK